MPVVGFLVIGAQKAGTNTLRHYLSRHPGIVLARPKEAHYFDDDGHFASGTPTHDRYHRMFPAEGGTGLHGEVTPIYLYWRPVMARVWAYNPDMRLIAVLRDPVARAYSAWNMERSRGNEPLPFEAAIEQEQQRLDAEPRQQHRTFSYLDRGRYAHQIERVWRYFPSRQLHLLRTEDLDRPAVTMQKIAAFLDIDPEPFRSLTAAREHAGAYRSAIAPRTHERLRNLFEPEVRRVETLLHWDLSDWRRPVA